MVSCNELVAGEAKEDLFTSKRGTENLPLDAAINLVRRLCRMPLRNVGEKFGIENYSSVSSAIQRMNLRVETDKHRLKKLNEIKRIAEKVKSGLDPILTPSHPDPISSEQKSNKRIYGQR